MLKGKQRQLFLFIIYLALVICLIFTARFFVNSIWQDTVSHETRNITNSYLIWLMVGFILLSSLYYFISKRMILFSLNKINQKLEKIKRKEILSNGEPATPIADPMEDFVNNIETFFSLLRDKIKNIERSKEYVETLVKTIQVSIIVFDESPAPVYINDYGLKKLKISKEETRKFNFTKLLREDLFSELKNSPENEKKTINRETLLYLNDGSRIDAEITIHKLYDAEKKLTGYISAIIDISQRKRAENNLKNQIVLSQQIFKTIPDMIFMLDIDLNVLFLNQKAKEAVIEFDLVGKNITSIFSKRSFKDGFDEILKNIARKGEGVNNINATNPFNIGGAYIDIIIKPIKSMGRTTGLLILIKDITEWRSLTSKHDSLQGFMAKLINASPYAIISLNENNEVSMWNSTAERIFGVSDKEVINKDIFDVIPAFYRYRDTINEVKILNKIVQKLDETLDLDKDKSLNLNLNFYSVLKEGRNVIIMVQDITQIKRLEDNLLQAQKMESLGLMTSSIIHDFNNVLTGILGYASLIKRKVEPGSEISKYISTLLNSSERATGMIKKVLEFSRKKLAKREVFNVNDIILEVLGFLNLSLKNITLQKSLLPEGALLSSDKTRISQALINIIINAKDALKLTSNALISISTELIQVRNKKNLLDGKYVLIKIADNGPGIKKENIHKIFDPFFTTKPKVEGLGLGLASIRDFVDDNNGEITVDSKLGKGTVFNLILPVVERIDLTVIKDKKVEYSQKIKGSVLIIDDEEVIRKIGSDMLLSQNIKCLTAGDGKEGIKLFQKQKDEIDVVILDIEMPGISGEKVYDRLKEINPDAKIIVCSGYSKEYIESKYFNRKIADFMPKPFQITQLLHKINKILQD